MSSYYANSRTNYFRVTDEEKYTKLFANLVCDEDEVYDFTKVENGVTLHAFGGYGSIDIRSGAIELARKMLKNKKFQTQMEY